MKIYPRVFFQDFIVLVFIAKSLVHFELIFVSVLTEGPSFLLFACASPHAKLPSTTSWKDCPFPTGWSWHPCWRSRAMCVWVHLRALNSSLLVYMSSLVTIPYCLSSCSFVVSFEIGKCESSNFAFCSQVCPGVGSPLHFYMNLRITFSASTSRALEFW